MTRRCLLVAGFVLWLWHPRFMPSDGGCSYPCDAWSAFEVYDTAAECRAARDRKHADTAPTRGRWCPGDAWKCLPDTLPEPEECP